MLATSCPCPQPPARFAGWEPHWPHGGQVRTQPEGLLAAHPRYHRPPSPPPPDGIPGVSSRPGISTSLVAPARVLASLFCSPLGSEPEGSSDKGLCTERPSVRGGGWRKSQATPGPRRAPASPVLHTEYTAGPRQGALCPRWPWLSLLLWTVDLSASQRSLFPPGDIVGSLWDLPGERVHSAVLGTDCTPILAPPTLSS